MKNNFYAEYIIPVILVVLLLLILNPLDLWMPTMAHVTVLVLLLVVFGLYASYVLREKAVDERDVFHRMFAGRVAFLSGTTVLIIGILAGAWHDVVDPWLISALVAMILSKIGARIYGDRNL